MNNGHLSDEQIQEVLDAEAFAPNAFTHWHLRTCRSCQERSQSFERLYAGLRRDPGFSLPPRFADAVLERIPAPRQAFFKGPLFRVALACAAAALLLSGLLLFVDLKPLAHGALRAYNSLRLVFRPLAGQLRELPAWFGGGAKLFVTGGLGLLGASLVEQFLRRQLLRRTR